MITNSSRFLKEATKPTRSDRRQLPVYVAFASALHAFHLLGLPAGMSVGERAGTESDLNQGNEGLGYRVWARVSCAGFEVVHGRSK